MAAPVRFDIPPAAPVPTLPEHLARKSYVDTADGLLIPLSQKGAASGVCELDSSSLIPRSRYYLATTTLDGTIRLTGDLGGTGTSPTVPGLANKQPLDGDLTQIASLTATTDNVIQSSSGAWASRTPAQLKATLALAKSDVGLGSVDNTADSAKPVSTAQQTALDGKASVAAGLPTGGATGSLLAKLSSTNYDDAWLSPTEVTALLDPATIALNGLMSTTDKKRMGAIYDAVADFGFVGDQWITLATTAVTGTAMTDSTNPFTAADVGKRVVIPRAGAGTAPNKAAHVTTIAAFVNSGQVTLANAVVTNVTSALVAWGTDNSAAEALMQSTINNQPWAGATVLFPRSATNRYGVQTCWTFNKSVQIEGQGGCYTADAGTWQTLGGTALAWWAASSDGGTPFQAMITFRPTGDQALKRVALRHIWLDCRNNDQNQALFGLELNSCHGHMLEDFHVNDPLATAIVMDVGSTPTEAKDCTRFSHKDVSVRAIDHTPGATTTPTTTSSVNTWTTAGNQTLTLGAANNLRTSGYVWVMTATGYPVLVYYSGGGGTTALTGCRVSADDLAHAPASFLNAFVVEATPGNASAYKLNGIVGANTCLGIIQMIQISYGTTWGPAAIEFLNCDSILFLQPSLNGGNATVEANGNRTRRPGFRFNGSNANVGLPSRNNIIYNGDPGAGGCISIALNNAGAALSFPAGPNKWFNYQLGNGSPIPIVEGAAQFFWTGNGCIGTGENGPVKTTSTSVPSASTAIIAQIPIPPQGLQVGLTVRCRFKMTKTAAGTAARTIGVKLGTTGTASDAIVNSVSRTPTAAADHGDEEMVFCITGPLGASCTSVMSSSLTKRLVTAAGLFNVAGALDVVVGTPVTFNSGAGQKWLSFYMTTGLSEVITILAPVVVEVLKGASP